MTAQISSSQASLPGPGQQSVEQVRNHVPGRILSDEEKFRKKEAAMARISIYIVILFGFCHSIQFILDTYDIVYTDIALSRHEVSCNNNPSYILFLKDLYLFQTDLCDLDRPAWYFRLQSVSHLLLTVTCSSNFYIYFSKHSHIFKSCF